MPAHQKNAVTFMEPTSNGWWVVRNNTCTLEIRTLNQNGVAGTTKQCWQTKN